MQKIVALGALFLVSVGLAACGGAGTAVPSQPGGGSAQSSQAIAAASGGTLSATFSGVKTTVTIPAGALAADTNVTLTVYGNSANLPYPFTGSFESGFSINAGATPLRMPLSVTVSGVSGAGSGSLLLYSNKVRAYTSVDATTASSGSITNQNATGYAGVSNVNGLPYVFSATAPSSPAPLMLAVVAATPGPYVIGTSAGFTASGSDANGNAYAFSPSFSLDNPAVGTIASTGNGATVTFGAVQVAGNVVVTDKRTGATGKLAVNVVSQRPANGGDTYAYAGTLTQTFNRTLPTPMPLSTTTTNVTQSIVVKSGQSYQGQNGLYDFALSETDTTALKTTTSGSDSYYGLGAPGASGTPELEYGTQWEDESGDTLATTYPAPLIIDELPETNGASWTNTAAAAIYENISNDGNGQAFTSHRLYAADGTYTETTTYPPGYISGGNAQSTIVQNADGSGSYLVPAFGGQINLFTYSAPQPAPTSSPVITMGLYLSATPAPSATPDGTIQIPAWYPANPVLYSESNVDNGLHPLPSTCNVPAAFGTQAMQLVQTINRLDTILGYTDTQTTTSYVIGGFGPVCVQLNDVQADYYDFNDDEPGLFYTVNNATAPYQTTTTSETLSLTQSGTSVAGFKSQSQTRTLTSALLRTARAPFEDAVNRMRVKRERAFAHRANRLIHTHGGR